VGLLLSQKFDESERRGAGWALVAVGALTTIPLIGSILHTPSKSRESLVAQYGFAQPART
jgi:hypothetical protein